MQPTDKNFENLETRVNIILKKFVNIFLNFCFLSLVIFLLTRVWLAMENLSLKTYDCLEPRIENWICRKIDNLSEKMTLKLEILDKRYDRIKIEILDKRKNEIKYHKEIFESHNEVKKKNS